MAVDAKQQKWHDRPTLNHSNSVNLFSKQNVYDEFLSYF